MAIVTSTIGIVLVTVLLVGGTTPTVVNRLKLRAITNNNAPHQTPEHRPLRASQAEAETTGDKDEDTAGSLFSFRVRPLAV